MLSEAEARLALVEAGRHFAAMGMAIGSAGNLSIRIADGYLVTPTNSALGRLDPARLSKLDPEFRAVGGDAPTKEVSLHRAFYETRPDCGAVVHLHSSHAAALSFRSDLPETDPIPPFSPYFIMRVGRVAVLPYARPGSDQIGEMIRGLGGRYRAVLLANHGPVNAGRSLAEAISAAEEFEETARLYLMPGIHPLRLLSDADIRDLVTTFQLEW
jgi:ribulose-5-phosphate 4-epimerase/fuculose-1-phosphate aldolase